MPAIEKTEEQIAKEREAVDAMRNAKANMSSALERITTLERALQTAITGLGAARKYISPECYTYPLNGQAKSVHASVDHFIAEAQKSLGVK